jgi:hypothetical protein
LNKILGKNHQVVVQKYKNARRCSNSLLLLLRNSKRVHGAHGTGSQCLSHYIARALSLANFKVQTTFEKKENIIYEKKDFKLP